MASPVLVPIVLNDVVLTVAADNYEAHVSKVEFVPSASMVKWKGLTPASVFNFTTLADWVLNLEYAQDWATAASLSQYLFDNEGTSKVVTFKPKKPSTGTAPTWTATVLITPGAIGGAVDSVATASVSLGVQGKPVRTVA
jgi:hypothetical protein